MDARIITFNNGLGDCPPFPKHLTSQYGINFGFSYSADGLLVDKCCGDNAQYFCYSVDGGETWETLVAGGIIGWPDRNEATIMFRHINQEHPFLTCRVEKTDDFGRWMALVGRKHDFPGKSDIINGFRLKKLVGDIISGKVDFDDFSFVSKGTDKALYDFFVNHSPRATMRDEHMNWALDRLKIYL